MARRVEWETCGNAGHHGQKDRTVVVCAGIIVLPETTINMPGGTSSSQNSREEKFVDNILAIDINSHKSAAMYPGENR